MFLTKMSEWSTNSSSVLCSLYIYIFILEENVWEETRSDSLMKEFQAPERYIYIYEYERVWEGHVCLQITWFKILTLFCFVLSCPWFEKLPRHSKIKKFRIHCLENEWADFVSLQFYDYHRKAYRTRSCTQVSLWKGLRDTIGLIHSVVLPTGPADTAASICSSNPSLLTRASPRFLLHSPSNPVFTSLMRFRAYYLTGPVSRMCSSLTNSGFTSSQMDWLLKQPSPAPSCHKSAWAQFGLGN